MLLFAKTKVQIYQLCSNRADDQPLCFRYIDSLYNPFTSEISSLLSSSVAVQPGLCLIRSEIPKTGFLMTWLVIHVPGPTSD